MKTLKIIAIAVLLLCGTAAGAQTMGVSDGHDLDALWAQAQKSLDVAQEDAIILLDSRTTTVGDEGAVVTRVHQVVWIATSQGIRGYADLRVPWNSANSTFEVTKLRTWMGGRWWPDAETISETAVVETLPYAVAEADDYTVLRETMLLHDGVELPCIMETDYAIAVQGSPTAGADGLFVFPQRDPVVRSEYVVRVPVGMEVKFESLNGAPQPVVTENGVKELAWTMDGAGALKQPVTMQPEAYEPAVVWTTWESWEALQGEFDAAVEAAAVLDEALADSVAAVVRGLPEGIDRLKAVVDFANRSVRIVHTDILPWCLAPRAAVRTYETGYGHALDRAVLVSALLRQLKADKHTVVQQPPVVLARDSWLLTAGELPRMADVDGVHVEIRTGSPGEIYDPVSGALRSLKSSTLAVRPGPDGKDMPGSGMTGLGRCLLDISLEPGEGEWTGIGTLHVAGDGHDALQGMASDASLNSTVQDRLSPVLAGATVTSVYPSLTMDGLTVRFAFGMPAPAAEADGSSRLQIGPIAAGPVHDFPHDVAASDETRASPVLRGRGEQRVTLRLHLRDRGVPSVPAEAKIDNAAGTFEVTVVQDDEWLTVTRGLDLRAADKAIPWSDLRMLLLEDMDPANGTIVLEKKQ